MSGDSLVVPVILAVTCLAIGLLGAVRRFPYGHWAGLRTKTTLSSRTAWDDAHVAAAPWLLAGGVAGLLVCGLAACERHPPSLLEGRTTPVVMAVEALFVVVATVVAQRAARRALH